MSFVQDVIEGELHALEELTVHFWVYRVQRNRSRNTTDWLTLNSISSTDCHVRVRVVFLATHEEYWDEAVSRFTNEIQAALPNLHCKNLLHLNFQTFSESEGDDPYEPYDDTYEYYIRG